MVISKAVLDSQKPTTPGPGPGVPVQDRWHTKLGKWNVAGARVRAAIVEYLDEVAKDVAYSDIKAHLIATLPDDCREWEGTEPSRTLKWQLGNTDVKGLVATLVVEGKAVDP